MTGVQTCALPISWIINPDPYVPKKTRVPEPSLKPLLPRPWELSDDETKLAAASQYEKWKADTKAKKEPEPKQVFTEKEKKWAKDFLTTPSQAELNMPDDYGRELRRQEKILEEKLKEESKKSGKQVAQLGMQNKQSIPPLIVKAGPEEDPDIIAAAEAQGITGKVIRIP